jgi:hypothetical protein
VRPIAVLAALTIPVVGAGCGGGTRMHSVRDVQSTFADRGVHLTVVERNRVSTALLPTRFVRAVRKTPALGKLPAGPGYEIVVFTDARRLRELPRRFARFTTRRDNVFIVYPAGAPSVLPRLKRILDDV